MYQIWTIDNPRRAIKNDFDLVSTLQNNLADDQLIAKPHDFKKTA